MRPWCSPVRIWSGIWLGLLTGCYGLPIKGYWQTIAICQLEIIGRPFTEYVNVLPISYCWQTPDAICKSLTKYCFAIYWANYVNSSSNLVFIFVTDTVFSIVKSYSFTVTLTECLKGLNLRLSHQDCFWGAFFKCSCCCPFVFSGDVLSSNDQMSQRSQVSRGGLWQTMACIVSAMHHWATVNPAQLIRFQNQNMYHWANDSVTGDKVTFSPALQHRYYNPKILRFLSIMNQRCW